MCPVPVRSNISPAEWVIIQPLHTYNIWKVFIYTKWNILHYVKMSAMTRSSIEKSHCTFQELVNYRYGQFIQTS